LEMIDAMSFIHKKKIFHLDLKPSNVLVNSDYGCKIADFGLSQKVQNVLPLMVGTPLYMAPEIQEHRTVSEKADVYSFGLILFALFFEEEPFYQLKDVEDIEQFWIQKIKFQLKYPDGTPEKLEDFIKKLTSIDPDTRSTFKEIIAEDQLYYAVEFKGDDKFKSIWEELQIGGREKVNTIELVYKFYEKYQIKPKEFENVKSSLAYKVFNIIMHPYEGEINEAGFMRFINVFGPLEDEPEKFMKRAESLLKKRSFWGYLGEKDANVILSHSSHGKSYLFRFSVAGGLKGKLTISYSPKKGEYKHYRFPFSRIDEIESNANDQGYKSGIKNMEELDFVSPHFAFLDESEFQVLTNITGLEGVQKQWQDLTLSLEKEGKTLEELIKALPEPKKKKKPTDKKKDDKKKRDKKKDDKKKDDKKKKKV